MRPTLALTALTLALATLGCGAQEAELPAARAALPPDILLVVVDSMRADRLLLERDGQLVAPTMARLAREGAYFERAYSQSGWTMPGLCAILTGRYPPVLSLQEGYALSWLPDEVNTLAGILGLYGYRSAVFWGRTVPHGFPELARGFDEVFTNEDKAHIEQPFRDEPIDWLEQAPQEPWFALVHNMDLHHADPPPPPQVADRWEPSEPSSPVASLDPRYGSLLKTHGDQVARRETIGAYDGVLSFYDGELAAILTAATAAARERDLVVVLTSNHGQDLWDHGFMGHGSRHYDSVLRVPLVWWDPRGPQGGQALPGPAQGIDLAPTLLTRVGATADHGMHGHSLLPWLGMAEGNVASGPIFSFSNPRGLSVIRGSDKLLVFADEGADISSAPGNKARLPRPVPHLFDLALDPGETTDLAAERPDTTAELKALLRAWAGEQRAGAAAGSAVPMNEDFRRTLQERGYWEHVSVGEPPPHPPGRQRPR